MKLGEPAVGLAYAFPPGLAMTPDDATAAQGGRALSRTKLGMGRVVGVLGTSTGEGRLPVERA